MVGVYVVSTVCDLAKPCKGLEQSTKAIRKLANSRIPPLAHGSEVVQRAMSRAELEATRATGLMRGGRQGTHYVSDAVNGSAQRAQQRLALPTKPEVRATLEVPRGVFSPPSRIEPLQLPNGRVLSGGGTERSAVGEVRVRVIKVEDL
jgi:hypothetical protein